MPWYHFVLRPDVQKFIVWVIVINSIGLGLETIPAVMNGSFGRVLTLLDTVALTIFVAEICLKIMALRLRFFKDWWNIFDFFIVGIACLPAAGPLAVLRSLRILRAMRIVSSVPKLRVIVQSLLQSLPSIGWISLLLVVVFYVFAVMGTQLFGRTFPEWFGSLGETYFTLFQVLTLESWSMGIARPVMEKFPMAYLFFVPFVLLTSFVVLNVFIAVIVGAMSDVREEERQSIEAKQPTPTEILAELRQLREEVRSLRAPASPDAQSSQTPLHGNVPMHKAEERS